MFVDVAVNTLQAIVDSIVFSFGNIFLLPGNTFYKLYNILDL